MKLYHYVHCPFCIRIRMVLGFLKQDYESIVLPYHDEKTPVDLMGVKMLPIMELKDKTSNESLDIISMLDTSDKLKTKQAIENYNSLEPILNKLGSDIHSLAMPYWIWTAEFNEESRKYFQTKKEVKRGPFKDLVKRRESFVANLNSSLSEVSHLFEKEITSESIELNDILLASHLWGMYVVPEFRFNNQVHTFLQAVKKVCHFNYHEDFWSH